MLFSICNPVYNYKKPAFIIITKIIYISHILCKEKSIMTIM
ncbi:hypothetical protein HMPREF9998_01438 [Peptostreptococcus anaerobius VPI 4330 = DSM 2949]|nr:hypothetical protein HMPREF9998_01438 [Peptostreptococcus anaerobius VPI 4330 = DSM 2949]